jgi:hypothetical protein
VSDRSGQIFKSEAGDKPYQLTPQDLQMISKLKLFIWLPESISMNKINLGFEKNNLKTYGLKNEQSTGSVLIIPLSDFFEEANANQLPGTKRLKMWLDSQDNESTTLVEFIPQLWYCQTNGCDFKTSDREEIIAHIKNHHISNHFKELDYQEIRSQFNPDLPAEIYQCGYCDSHIYAENKTNNPTRAIINHIHQCSKAISKNGSPFISFKIVSDTREIRKFIQPGLPVIYKCLICDECFENQSNEDVFKHLIERHEQEILIEKETGE